DTRRPNVWHRQFLPQPLALDGDRLAVLAGVEGKANAVRVVVLSVGKRGEQTGSSKPIVFPEWVVVGLEHGRSFEASGLMHKGDLYVRWEAHAFNDRMPPPDNPNAGQKDAAGVARVGLDGGAVALLPADKFPVEAAALPAALREQQSAPYYV